jgi:hypothetical protein
MSDRDDHHEFGPSRLPALACCPRYVGGEVGEAAHSGTRQHKALEQMMNGFPVDVDGLIEDERANAEWAAGYIQQASAGYRVLVEERVEIVEDFEPLLFGRADVILSKSYDAMVIDYKSGAVRNYREQMAAYARGVMQLTGLDYCTVVELYGKMRKAVAYLMTYEETDFILPIIARAKDPASPPTACDYCGWCANQTTCEAVQREVVKVAAGYQPELDIIGWHGSEVTDPQQMAIGLRLADVVSGWAESWKHHVKQAMLDGMEVPGYRIARIPSKEFGDDIRPGQIFTASGLNVDRFSDCCDVKITKLREAIANDIGMKTASGKAAKEEFNKRFGALLSDKEIVRLEKEK